MKLWVDDVRPRPMQEGWVWCKSVKETQASIMSLESRSIPIELIDIDHDAGDYANQGGDYIKILDWMERTNRSYPIRIHSMNPVGVENMRAIIQKNGWTEVH